MVKRIDMELRVKDKGTATVKKFGSQTSSMMKKLAGPLAIGAVVASLSRMASHILKVGDQLGKMSKRTGFTVETLDKLRQAAILGGTSIQAMEKSIRRLQKNTIDAARGVGLAKEAFDAMGISVNKLMALSPEQQFQAIAQELLKIEDPTLRAARAQELLGISGTNLIPVLNDIASGLQDYNASFTTEQVKNIEKFNDNISIMKERINLLATEALAPAVKWLNELLLRFQLLNKYADDIKLDKINTELRLLEERLKELNKQKGLWYSEEAITVIEKEIAVLKKEKAEIESQIKVKVKEKDATKAIIDVTGKDTENRKENAKAIKKQTDELKKLADEVIRIKQARMDELGVFDESFMAFLTEPGIPKLGKESLKKKTRGTKAEEDASRERSEKIIKIRKEEIRKSEELARAITDNVLKPFADVIAGTKTIEDAFKQMIANILQEIAMAAIAEALGAGGGGGGGGLLGSLFGGLAGSGGAGGGIGGGGGSMPYIPAMADGGIVNRPTLATIGESGTEAVIPLKGGKVPIEGDSGGTQNTFIITAVDSKSFDDMIRRNPSSIIKAITSTIQNGNQGFRQTLKRAVG